jgi:ABC-2 type transport system permease protein
MQATHNVFSWPRLVAMIRKEFIQMLRDRMTFGLMFGMPIVQLILFGYAINMTPKHLPTAINSQDSSAFTRTLVQGLKNTDYFQLVKNVKSEKEGRQLLQEGKATFVLNIPVDFTRKLIRNEHPTVLLQVDGTDPSASGSAISAVNTLVATVFNRDLTGPLQHVEQTPPPVNLDIQTLYNAKQSTQYNIVPGLLGVVLTMTLVVITSQVMTKERERGTMESLLATPLRPLEVILGKLAPFLVVGYVQAILIISASYFLFGVPIVGNLLTLAIAMLPFIFANLAIGVTFSTIAKNQLQAVQAAFFFFLPSILLSGFMFPFRGMPMWAQWIGNALPLTHFLVIVRGIMLKGNGWMEIWPQLWPLLLFMCVAVSIALLRYRQTLD